MPENEQNSIEISADLLTQIEREACQNSFFEFVQSFWGVIIQEEPKFNWHIPYLCSELEKILDRVVKREPKESDLLINISPGTTKTTIVTIMFPVFAWLKDPTLRIISNSYGADMALEQAMKSRDIIQSPKFKRLFPEITLRKDKSAKSFYSNTKTGSRFATSTGSAVTGEHAHIILSDDPMNRTQATSDVIRHSAIEHTKTLASRKVDAEVAVTITIMQRLHEGDVSAYLLEKGVRHICLPAELSDRVKPAELKEKYVDGLFDPVRLSRKVLEEQKINLGSRGFACEYEQNPVADGGNIVKREWFKFIHPNDFQKLKQKEPVIFFADTAFTDKKENDPTGLISTVMIMNDLYIINAEKVLMKFPDLIRYLPQYVSNDGYTNESTIRIEPKANGLSVIDQLREMTSLNVVSTPSPKDSKETRLHATSPRVECGRVWLVIGSWNEDFIDEICGFPAKNHDEYVDLLCYASDYHFDSNTGVFIW